MADSFGPLSLSVTTLSITAVLYGLGVFVKSKKKLGVRALLASLACQILFWDFLRCLTVGLVSGIWYIFYPDMTAMCYLVGPLTDMSHRVSFFLVLGHVILCMRKSEESGCVRKTAIGFVVIGYILCISYALLPYFLQTSYVMGQEGFCTFYSDQIFTINYETLTETEIFQKVLQHNILLSVLPFATMFLLLLVGVVVASCSKNSDSVALVEGVGLLVGYMPMMGVGMALVADYFGLHTILTSYNPEHMTTQMLILFCSMVIFPVSTPLIKLFLNTAIHLYRRRKEVLRRDSQLIQKNSSNSTTILIHDVDIVCV